MNKEQFLEACKKEKSFGECFYAVYDNFLPYQEFGLLKDYTNGGLGWRISSKINYNDTSNNDFYLTSLVFSNERTAREQWANDVHVDAFTNITSKIHIDALMRIKANLYASSAESKIHAPHVDYSLFHIGALFYVTDCDAPTYMADGTEIESKENRLLIFNASTPHSSSAPTNVPFRITININYFGAGVQPGYIMGHTNSIPTIISDNYPFKLQNE
jgi:hypothetical protein|tara:strand:+ start:3440 stop:4087 length:648 start_codon:yes stop_codon:yes gene_type:complete